MHFNNFGEFFCTFCSLTFLFYVNQIWEERVWKFKFCSFCLDNFNQRFIFARLKTRLETLINQKNAFEFWPIKLAKMVT